MVCSSVIIRGIKPPKVAVVRKVVDVDVVVVAVVVVGTVDGASTLVKLESWQAAGWSEEMAIFCKLTKVAVE